MRAQPHLLQSVLQNENLSRMTKAEMVSFYIGFPLLAAFILGWNNPLMTGTESRTTSIFVLAVLLICLWGVTALVTSGMYRLLAQLRPPLWLTTLIGVFVAALILLPLVRVYFMVVYGWTADDGTAPGATPISFSMSYFRSFFASVFPGALSWVAINYFYRDVLGVPRYGTMGRGRNTAVEAAPPEPGESFEPPFMKKLPAHLHGTIHAIKAEDHYIHVYTDKGSDLVRWNFSDALLSLEALNGIRVHRSYWVNQHAITSLEKVGHSHVLHLQGDLTVPVSRKYLAVVQAAVKG